MTINTVSGALQSCRGSQHVAQIGLNIFVRGYILL